MLVKGRGVTPGLDPGGSVRNKVNKLTNTTLLNTLCTLTVGG